MKVVLFCGGLGTRLRENSDITPKPLVRVGDRAIVWHLMRYYAHHGHNEFILCLGYRGDLLREYFLNYNEAMSNDFTLSEGGRRIDLHNSDIDDWKITFVDTGLHTSIGQRLVAIRQYIGDDEIFLANYADGLSDVPINTMIDNLNEKGAVASFVAVRPPQSFHAAKFDDDCIVTSLGEISDTDFWINGGFFVMRNKIFDYIHEDEELVEQPFDRIIREKKLAAFPHKGFWQPMDTFKNKVMLDRLYAQGDAPWQVWKD